MTRVFRDGASSLAPTLSLARRSYLCLPSVSEGCVYCNTAVIVTLYAETRTAAITRFYGSPSATGLIAERVSRSLAERSFLCHVVARTTSPYTRGNSGDQVGQGQLADWLGGREASAPLSAGSVADVRDPEKAAEGKRRNRLGGTKRKGVRSRARGLAQTTAKDRGGWRNASAERTRRRGVAPQISTRTARKKAAILSDKGQSSSTECRK